MKVRQLSSEERFEADVISHIAFHMRMENPEEVREKSRQATVEDWGAFDDDGRMMARIINHRYESFLDGNRIVNGGIGAVSTLPEYRNTGAVRAIFRELIPSAFRAGEIISTLYPFNHAFYRKFGYETICMKNRYIFAPEVLSPYRFEGKAVQWKPGNPLQIWLDLYHHFAAAYNLAICRSEESFVKAHFQGTYLKDRKFAYLLLEQDKPVAYVIFQDVRHDPAAILRVEDAAWDGQEGFLAILGFLSRFSADYGSVELSLPMGLELLNLIQSPKAYEIEKNTQQDYMLRVVNARRLLEYMRKPPRTRFVIEVQDDLIPENTGIWEVTDEKVIPAKGEPDLKTDIRALGQLAVGAVSLFEAEYRRDVTVCGNRSALASVFIPRPIFVEDHF